MATTLSVNHTEKTIPQSIMTYEGLNSRNCMTIAGNTRTRSIKSYFSGGTDMQGMWNLHSHTSDDYTMS